MDVKEEKIKQVLLDFDWDDYGMDFVNQCQPDWAENLAERIASECG